jgi:hypothetical protein
MTSLALIIPDLLSAVLLPVELVPQPGVHESLAAEYLLVVFWALLLLVAAVAKELLEIFSFQVMDSLTR